MASEDTRVWVGHIAAGREDEHHRFVDWLNGPEAHQIFARRRLTEYLLRRTGLALTVIFRAPHTGDPRLMIDVLRYPGLWPEFWEFERSGSEDDTSAADTDGTLEVHWRRDTTPS